MDLCDARGRSIWTLCESISRAEHRSVSFFAEGLRALGHLGGRSRRVPCSSQMAFVVLVVPNSSRRKCLSACTYRNEPICRIHRHVFVRSRTLQSAIFLAEQVFPHVLAACPDALLRIGRSKLPESADERGCSVLPWVEMLGASCGFGPLHDAVPLCIALARIRAGWCAVEDRRGHGSGKGDRCVLGTGCGVAVRTDDLLVRERQHLQAISLLLSDTRLSGLAKNGRYFMELVAFASEEYCGDRVATSVCRGSPWLKPRAACARAQLSENVLSVGVVGAGEIVSRCISRSERLRRIRLAYVADRDSETARVAANSFGTTPVTVTGQRDELPQTDVVLLAVPVTCQDAVLRRCSPNVGPMCWPRKPLANCLRDAQRVCDFLPILLAADSSGEAMRRDSLPDGSCRNSGLAHCARFPFPKARRPRKLVLIPASMMSPIAVAAAC